jgi:pilus assembly protein CpaF
MEGEHITMHDLFAYEQSGVDENGHANGQFVCCGIRPKVAQRIESRGLKLPAEMFVRKALPEK